jgi:enoyl-CoA hydratase
MTTTTTEPVRYELEGPIATITMDDGKVNAFSIPMLQAVHSALDQAERDEAIVVLKGREKYFSAGFDLKGFSSGLDGLIEMLTLGATLSERILCFPRPVVAACSGHAIAAGSFILLAADVRIGVDGPWQIGLNEVKIGLTVPWFAIELARYRLHPTHFDRAVVGATMYSPQEAVVPGFLDQVVSAEELQDVSMQTAAQLAELNAGAHAATKLRARASAQKAIRSAIETELTPEGLGAE